MFLCEKLVNFMYFVYCYVLRLLVLTFSYHPSREFFWKSGLWCSNKFEECGSVLLKCPNQKFLPIFWLESCQALMN